LRLKEAYYWVRLSFIAGTFGFPSLFISHGILLKPVFLAQLLLATSSMKVFLRAVYPAKRWYPDIRKAIYKKTLKQQNG